VTFRNVIRGEQGGPYACPCCTFWTLPQRGSYDICPVCFWEDDGQDDHDADAVRTGGPNGRISLTDARRNFAYLGASSAERAARVRAPTDAERAGPN
jgi:hypothetical protein